MAQIETNEDRSSLSHSQMEPGNNDRKREKKRERARGGVTLSGCFVYAGIGI